MTVAIVTDSTSDIPANLTHENGIEVVPNLLMIDDHTYVDGEGITREDFYRQLSGFKKPPTTAAPSTRVYEEVFDRLLRQGASQIISLHPSKALSALYSIATVAAQSFSSRITTYDSSQVSLGLGFMALAAARYARAGATVAEILQSLDRIKHKIRVIALLDTLEYVRRSGRVNWVTSSLGSFFRLRAIIEVRQGTVHRLGLSRTRRQGFNQLLTYIRRMGPLDELAILHTTPPHAEEAAQIVANLPHAQSEAIVVPVTTIIGTHVGPGGIGVAAVLR